MSVFALDFSQPWYDGGSATASTVGSTWDIAIDGVGYMLDPEALGEGNFMLAESMPSLRERPDTSGDPGEQSLNTDGLWRRSQSTWHRGAGQDFYDRDDSEPERFRASKGLDPWTPNKLTLLPGTLLRYASANANVAGVTVGTRYYFIDGQALKFTTDLTVAATTVTGTPAAVPSSITTDGYNVWVAYAGSGIYTTNRATGAASQLITDVLDASAVLGYANGRLMLGDAHRLYNVTATSVTTLASGATLLYTPANTDWRWVGFAEGPVAIYAAGYSGDKSIIFRVALADTASVLAAPTVATPLLDGETVRAIQGYVNKMVLIGTDAGWRFALVNADASLALGDLVETDNPVRCFEPQGRFVWFGLENYDTVSTGLGRLAPGEMVGTGTAVPARASDLMYTGQGQVTSVATFGGKRVFTVASVGVVGEGTNLVASGTLETGLISWKIGDDKNGLFADVRCEPLAGTIAVAVGIDSADFVPLDTLSEAGSTGGTFDVGQRLGENFEFEVTVSRSATVATTGPTLTRTVLRVEPAPDGVPDLWHVPLLLGASVRTRNGTPARVDPDETYEVFRELKRRRRIVVFQRSRSRTEQVSVFGYKWPHRQETADTTRLGRESTLIVTLKAVE